MQQPRIFVCGANQIGSEPHIVLGLHAPGRVSLTPCGQADASVAVASSAPGLHAASGSPDQSSAATVDVAAERIQAHHARKAARRPLICPACSNLIWAPLNVLRHMATCCPDLMTSNGDIGGQQEWNDKVCMAASNTAKH